MKPRTQSKATAASGSSRPRILSPAKIEGAVRAPLPTFVAPCLATLVAKPPEGDEWVHEIKFDGYRIEARINEDGVKLLTRKGLDWTHRFGAVPRLLRQLHRGTALIDGELVVEDSEGHTSFTALAEALKGGHSERFVLQCFDLLYLDGFNLMGATLIDRKALLRGMFGRTSKTGPSPL